MFSRKSSSRALGAAVLLAALAVFGAAPAASADVICGDICQVGDTVVTPVGPATVTVSPTNVVTVSLAPTSRTLVFGVAFVHPPGPCFQFCARTTIESAGGTIDIDTVVMPPGPPTRFTFPNLAVISIHPPNPCRVQTAGNTVTFTPIA